MIKPCLALVAALTAALLVSGVSAAPPKAAAAKTGGKTVAIYQADKCHMYYSAAQAKKYKYACPDSKGKMKMVKVPAAVAAKGLAATAAALAPKKTM